MAAVARAFWTGTGFAISPSSDTLAHERDGPVAVLLVQRDLADKRAFSDLDGLINAGLRSLEASGAAVWRSIDDLSHRSLLQQAAMFRSTEVLIGAVGAALAWLVVMRPGAQVLEWLPQGVPPPLYRCTESWNADSLGMFGGLGRLSSVDHVCLHSEAKTPEVPDRSRWSAARTTAKDAYWRTRDLVVDVPKFVRWTAEGVRRALQTRPEASAM
eukprot:gnl/TRDRNA2_/TRDRNA2_150219_c1_seq1.p1 gnl/TRDRNA2_/TRDRNA2_150219_c1~~gnl/TRDRNA2_/TRDRNA2_150219_c1_seq1.p1  ORF type:complete len:226 (+),score=29.99 gnl/TRDRNA2_/TRDRNA2_150219_c1_seq1:38-679(+)